MTGEYGDQKNESGKKKKQKVPFYKLFSFADSKDIALMVVGTIGAMGCGLTMPMMSFIYGDLINAFGFSNRSNVVHSVSVVALRFVALAAAAAVTAFLQVTSWTVSGERQASRIRRLYLKTILRQDIAFFDNETTTGEVIGRMSGDTVLIQEAMGEKVGKFIQLVSTFFGGFIIAFLRGWRLTLVMLSSIPLIIVAGMAMSLTISKLSTRGQAAYAEAGAVVDRTVGSIRTVVSFNGEKAAIEEYDRLIKAAYRSTVHSGIALGLGIGSVMMIVFCSYGFALWYGAKLILRHGYSGGVVINVVMAVMMGGMSLGQTSPCLSAFGAGQAAAFKMFETIKRKPTIDVYATDGLVLEEEDIKGEIELKDVKFRYPARPEQLIFNGFSLQVPSGTTMALVGSSGSGKSTVVGLLERFYDPEAGEVCIDGVNLKKFNLRWIRSKIGLVSQEPILFTTTIRENIAYGKEDATPQEINRAIELANAAKFISKLPQGLDTMAGEQGTQLSGGQKQRIAIARAILKSPKILLLDEATSALDAESERIVQEALERIMLDQTTVVIAHRLSTVKNADKISVLQQGKLIEQGSHSDLIKNRDGPYSQLIRLQGVNQKSENYKGSNRSFETESARVLRSSSRSSSIGGTSRNSFFLPLGLPSALPLEGEEFSEEELRVGGKSEAEVPKEVSIKRLTALNKPETPILIIGSIAASAYGTALPLYGLMISSAIKTFFEPHDILLKDATRWTLMLVSLGVFCLFLIFIQQLMFSMAGGKLVERARSMSFARVVHQEISWFDQPSNSSGAVGARLSTDASTIRGLVGDTLGMMLQNVVTVIAGFVIAMTANWRLALVVITVIPLIGMQGAAQMRFLKGFGANAKAMYEEASQVASDAVGNIRTVASFCAEEKVMAAYELKCDGPVRNAVRQGVTSGLGYGFSFAVLFCSYALCFYVGAIFVKDGTATFGQVFKVFFALTMAAVAVSQSGAFGTDTTKAKNSAASIFAILDRHSLVDSSSSEGLTMAEDQVRGEIEFRHVSFKYPTRPDVQIFRDLCLTINAGKTVALVGESGSGKSTTIALLERFYDPDAGEILLDGVRIQDLNVGWLRRQLGLVSQEPVLFSGTIRDNIAYGKLGFPISEEEIIRAAESANVHLFISSLPQGYSTSVGDRGVQLSGGQKQRIAIARAIVKDPRVLLLDEATSALDAESERVVQEALDRVMIGRTSVVVAHRLSTITGADKIAVVKNGAVAEHGRHEQLLGIEGGAYASLMAMHSSA